MLYETPQTEVFEVLMDSACLQVTSDITTENDGNPMPWGDGNED